MSVLTFSEDFATQFKAKSVGDCFMIEEDEGIFVLNKLDVLEREELKDNEKDLAKLREDKKFFDQRV